MPPSVTCASCGYSNEVGGHVFCIKCGKKLDFTKLEAQLVKRGKVQKTTRFIGTVVRLIVLLGLVSILGALLWPVAPAGESGSKREGLALNEKLKKMRTLINIGKPFEVTVHEKEINGYLRVKVEQTAKASPSLAREQIVDEVNLDFTKDYLIVLIRAMLGPVPMSYEFKGVPVAGNPFTLDITHVRLGHMPIPGPLKPMVEDRAVVLFKEMGKERSILSRMDRFILDEGKIKLVRN